MKKIIVVSLSILCMCCIAIGLTGCSNNGHVHAFDKQVVTDEYKATDATCTEKATYYYSCSCGEKGTETFAYGSPLGHSFTNYVSDNNATCTQDGTKTAKCDRCNEKNTVKDIDSMNHSYTEQIVSDEYLAAPATCAKKATYYYSCKCGEKGAGTFAYGSPLGHSFTNYVSDNNATCTQDGTKTAKCDRCNEKNTVKDIDSKLNHSYTEQIVSEKYLASSATCAKKATYYYSCKCGEKGTETFEYGSITNHNFVNDSCTYCGKKQETSRGLAFTLLYDGTYEISGIGSCTDTEIVIPSVYEDKPVTSIGYYAFRGRGSLTSVTIPDSVTSIGYGRFDGCSGLTSITIPDSVTSIGERAFYGCSGLTSVTIPDSVTSIGHQSFRGCSGLTSITISDSLTSITSFAFYGCSGLTSITIPNSVTSIEGRAFSGCSGLTSITIPNSVTSINDSAFNGCSGLTSITIPDSVTSIGDRAFEDCSGLTSITIPDSVTSIGDRAFEDCSGLESIYITDIAAWCNISGLEFMRYYGSSNKKLYLNNELITDLVVPGSVTSIGDYAFSGCTGLRSITIPNSVTSIGNEAFAGCSGLEKIEVESGNKKYHSKNSYIIETQTKTLILGCKNSVIPSDGSVTSIGDYAFSGCTGLTSVTIPDSVTSIGGYAFYRCSGLTSVTIPDSVTSIGGYAFCGCSSLTSVTIPNSVITSIGSSTFNGCSGLTSVTIPNSVPSIGNWAFAGCSGLTSVTIPNSVTLICDAAFNGCSGLKNITYTGTIAEWKKITKGMYWDRYVPEDCVIHCSDGDIGIHE